MIFSTFNEFKKNYKKKNFSQIYAIKNKPKLETIDKLVELVSLNKDSFIFESVEKVKIRGRYTIFGFNPDLVIETKTNCIIQNINNKKIVVKKNPYDYLNKLINNFNFKTSKKLPMMSAMLAGYFGYDIIRFKEKIPNNCKEDLKIPDVKLIRPQLIIIHDNEKNKIFFVQNIYNLKNIKNLKNLYLLKCDEINKFVKEKKRANIQLVKSEMGHLDTEEYDLHIPDIDLRLNYGEEFTKVHDVIVQRLNKKNDMGIILLHGDPGTGKTSYIKYLTKLIKDKVIRILTIHQLFVLKNHPFSFAL